MIFKKHLSSIYSKDYYWKSKGIERNTNQVRKKFSSLKPEWDSLKKSTINRKHDNFKYLIDVVCKSDYYKKALQKVIIRESHGFP